MMCIGNTLLYGGSMGEGRVRGDDEEDEDEKSGCGCASHH